MALLVLKNLNMTDSTLLQHCTWLWTYLLHIDCQRVRLVKIDNDSFIYNALGMKGEKGIIGVRGPPGLKGPSGSRGPKGQKGERGYGGKITK